MDHGLHMLVMIVSFLGTPRPSSPLLGKKSFLKNYVSTKYVWFALKEKNMTSKWINKLVHSLKKNNNGVTIQIYLNFYCRSFQMLRVKICSSLSKLNSGYFLPISRKIIKLFSSICPNFSVNLMITFQCLLSRIAHILVSKMN